MARIWRDVETGEVAGHDAWGLPYLHQDEVWTDRDGVEHRLEDMDLSYLLNLRRFLLRRSWWLELSDAVVAMTSIWAPRGQHALAALDEEMDWRSEHHRTWLLRTPLLRRIDSLIELRVPGAAASDEMF